MNSSCSTSDAIPHRNDVITGLLKLENETAVNVSSSVVLSRVLQYKVVYCGKLHSYRFCVTYIADNIESLTNSCSYLTIYPLLPCVQHHCSTRHCMQSKDCKGKDELMRRWSVYAQLITG
jgi:hypothetical protein